MTSDEIRALRNSMGLSREKFARLVGVSAGTIYGWERDDGRAPQSDVTRDRLEEIAELHKKTSGQK